MSADDHSLTPVIVRLRKDPIFQTEENPIFLPSGRSDRLNTDIRSVFIRSPHRGEQRKDRTVLAQCAGTALSSAGSAGIYGAIPAEFTEHTEADHY